MHVGVYFHWQVGRVKPIDGIILEQEIGFNFVGKKQTRGLLEYTKTIKNVAKM